MRTIELNKDYENYFKGLSDEQILMLARKSINITAENRKLINFLIKIYEKIQMEIGEELE